MINDEKIAAAKAEADRRNFERVQWNRDHVRLMSLAKTHGVAIAHIFNKDIPNGGLTIAYKKATGLGSGHMVTVAVATCSPSDIFNKKLGANLAVSRFFDGYTMDLPLLLGYEQDDIGYAVKRKFTALYNV